jgi:hypothetical protein
MRRAISAICASLATALAPGPLGRKSPVSPRTAMRTPMWPMATP